MPTLYVPRKKPSEIQPEDMSFRLNFYILQFDVEDEGVRFTQYDDHPLRQNSRNEGFSVLVTKKGTLQGKGSRLSRSYILHAYEWYKIAKRETNTNLPDDFIDRLIYDPLDE